MCACSITSTRLVEVNCDFNVFAKNLNSVRILITLKMLGINIFTKGKKNEEKTLLLLLTTKYTIIRGIC